VNLSELRHRLLDLHRALVDSERRDYEQMRGRLSDGEFLDALINDPNLVWLSALLALIVRMDELLEEEPVAEAALNDCVVHLRKLIKPDASGSEFQRRYAEVLQRSPEVVVAHGNVMRALQV
jgi:hypothetical protein